MRAHIREQGNVQNDQENVVNLILSLDQTQTCQNMINDQHLSQIYSFFEFISPKLRPTMALIEVALPKWGKALLLKNQSASPPLVLLIKLHHKAHRSCLKLCLPTICSINQDPPQSSLKLLKIVPLVVDSGCSHFVLTLMDSKNTQEEPIVRCMSGEGIKVWTRLAITNSKVHESSCGEYGTDANPLWMVSDKFKWLGRSILSSSYELTKGWVYLGKTMGCQRASHAKFWFDQIDYNQKYISV